MYRYKMYLEKPFQEAMQNYFSAPLMDHKCYKDQKKDSLERSQSKRKCFKEIDTNLSANLLSTIEQNLPSSSLGKDGTRRHAVKSVEKHSKVLDSNLITCKMIFDLQKSDLMKEVADIVPAIKNCAEKILQSLKGDELHVCESTRNYYDSWLSERHKRITGSTCYKVYTYTNNRNPDWNVMSQKIFCPKDFKTVATEYGRLTEAEARGVFRTRFKKDVIETGLIILKQNPWLGHSPDGVIFSAGEPESLLEIKCPEIGKSVGIQGTVVKCLHKFLVSHGENVRLREKHQFYGQIQLGMAVINVQYCYFVVYSSCDKNMFVLKIGRDNEFILKMLSALKKIYYSTMVHSLCLMENPKLDSQLEQ